MHLSAYLQFSSLLLFALALLLFLFLREGVHHQELTVSWIPLCGQVCLVLIWHQHCTFQCFHVWNVDISFILFMAWVLRSGQVVPDRHYFFHLGLSSTVDRIFGNKIELFTEAKLRQAGHSLDFFRLARRDDLTFFVFLLRRWLPSRQFLDEVLSSVRCLRPS